MIDFGLTSWIPRIKIMDSSTLTPPKLKQWTHTKHNQQPFYSTPLIIKPLASPWHPWPTLSAPETYIFRSIQSQRAFLGRGLLAKGGETCVGSYNNKGKEGWKTNKKHESHHEWYHEWRAKHTPWLMTFRINFKTIVREIPFMNRKIAPHNTLVAKNGAYVNMSTWIMCTNWLHIQTTNINKPRKQNSRNELHPL